MLKVSQQNTIPFNNLTKNINYQLLIETHSRKSKNTEKRSRYRRSDAEPDDQKLPFPRNFLKGEAVADGDCFFDSLAQGMNQLNLGELFDVKSLRQACFDYARDNAEAFYDSQTGQAWLQAIAEDASLGGYATNSEDEAANFNSYLVRIQLKAEEISNLKLGLVIWGRPEIEGRLLCQKYGIKIHLIEKHTVDGQEVIVHSLEDGSGSRQLNDKQIYNDPKVVHILNERRAHFVPILHKSSASNKPIEKQARSSPLEGVQLQDKPIDRLAPYPDQSSATNSQRELAIPHASKSDNRVNRQVPTGTQPEKAPQSAQQSGNRQADNEEVLNSSKSSSSSQAEPQTILPPFSGKLKVDKSLKLRREKFKESINALATNKPSHALGTLQATAAYPKPYIFAQFASKAYTDYLPREQELDYEKRLALPSGWKLLMTASNSGRLNGYFGAAYWHPKNHQVVIAHRGTKPTNLGADWADIKGVLFNHYVSQMNSASTFADKVISELKAVSKEKGVNFQLFFTGHSLGGWLAQITTFTTEYLKKGKDKKNEEIFIKIDTPQENSHAHTVVFDSPGCKVMLLQMKYTFDVRLKGSISLQNLDITSYLSAPNRINTCNTHLGTVYRIFVDLSDMGFLEKNTPKYHLATHSMDKILQAFDSRTGQVLKDENGQLKIQEVVDWPIGTGLRGGKELQGFFKWAVHLNDYHPTITSDSFSTHLTEGYYPIRYQTQVYDERVTSLNVFTQSEQDFLKCYSWLRGLEEFFKPENLLPETRDNTPQLQNSIKQKLNNFEIDNQQRIVCTGSETLTAFIPYVKRLIQMFPQIKENTRKALEPFEIRGKVYQSETKSYLEEIQQSSLDFNDNALDLGSFIANEQQQVWRLRMLNGDAGKGLTKVYKVFQKTAGVSDYPVTVLKLKRLLEINQLISLNALLGSMNELHLLILACEIPPSAYNEAEDLFKKLFDTVKQKQNIKIILTTPSADGSVDFIQETARETLGHRFITREERLTWGDLTVNAREELLKEKIVTFQSDNIPLNQLINLDPQLEIYEELLNNILDDKPIKINDEPIRFNDLQATYVVDQGDKIVKASNLIAALEDGKSLWVLSGSAKTKTLEEAKTLLNQLKLDGDDKQNKEKLLEILKNHGILEEALIWEKEKIVRMIILSCEGENCLHKFKSLCSDLYAKPDNYPWYDKKLIHWVAVEQGQLVLKKSVNFNFYFERDLNRPNDKFSETERQDLIIIDEPGMGKSTTLTHLAQKALTANWVIRLNFKELEPQLEKLNIDHVSVSNFLADRAGYTDNPQRFLLRHNLEYKTQKPLLLLLDGFDEIQAENNKNKALNLLEFLKEKTPSSLIITARKTDQQSLERLYPSSTFEPFTRKDREDFLKNFWNIRFSLTKEKKDIKEIFSEDMNSKFNTYAKELLDKVDASLGDKESRFIGVPLQMQMLAVVYQGDFDKFIESGAASPEPNHFTSFSLNNLYEKFINEKYELYFKKCKSTGLGPDSRKNLKETYTKAHRKLAVQLLFKKNAAELLKEKDDKYGFKELYDIGIIQQTKDGNEFIHRTWGEYYAANFLISQLKKIPQPSSVREFLLTSTLFAINSKENKNIDFNYKVVRNFLNAQLENLPPDSRFDPWPINDFPPARWVFITISFTTACADGNKGIVNFLIKSIEDPEILKKIFEMTYIKNHYGLRYKIIPILPPLHNAVLKNHLEIVTILMDNQANIDTTDRYSRTPLNLAAQEGQLDMVNFLIQRHANIETPDELGSTPLLGAAYWGHAEIVETLLDNRANVDAKTNKGETASVLADQNKHKEVGALIIKYKQRLLSINMSETAERAQQIFEPVVDEAGPSCGSRRRRDLRGCGGVEVNGRGSYSPMSPWRRMPR